MSGQVVCADRTDQMSRRRLKPRLRPALTDTPVPESLRGPLATVHKLATKPASGRTCLCLVFPVACLCFWGGALLSLAHLPDNFDYGRCVISRLCSSHHNPHGYLFMSTSMMLTPILLWVFSSWMVRGITGCPMLCAWGWGTMRIGLVATALVGAERAWFPVHWTRFEALHLVFAGLAFGCLWLGLAMLEGATESSATRVRWRWLYRPSWYLVLTLLPILVVFGMCAPLNLIPGARLQALNAWPESLVFLRTLTFWQWYLVGGLGLSFGSAGWAHYRRGRAPPANMAWGWRRDRPTASPTPTPHQVLIAKARADRLD